jgi:hypothetical protein
MFRVCVTLFLLILLLSSCTRPYTRDNRFYSFGHNSFTHKSFEGKITSCKKEYDKYHPKFASKTCSKVVDRKCVINNYCKGNQSCIADAKEFYYPYLVKNDEEYCLCVVKAKKTGEGWSICNAIK